LLPGLNEVEPRQHDAVNHGNHGEDLAPFVDNYELLIQSYLLLRGGSRFEDVGERLPGARLSGV